MAEQIQQKELEEVIRSTRRRASGSRLTYYYMLMAMLIVAASLVALFLRVGEYTFTSKTAMDPSLSQSSSLLILVASGIARLGAVVFGIFAIQTLFSFARYHARLAQHLESVADALQLSGGDVEGIRLLVVAIAPQGVDFGKAPKSPTEHAFELAADIFKAAKDRH